MYWNYLAAIGAFIWLVIMLLPWRPWDTREVLDSASDSLDADLSDITVIIPARNEAEVIGKTLGSLKTQGQGLQIVLVDDRSADETATVAKTLGVQNLRLLSGEPLPANWSGKLWALEQGFRLVNTPLTLLIDADIELRPGIVGGLRQKLREDHLQFISLMAQLRMISFWERLLMPAFVYFFKMLYPFHLANSSFTPLEMKPRSSAVQPTAGLGSRVIPAWFDAPLKFLTGFTRVAAAAGGCILLETRLIEEIGGFETIRQELIDDCALAKRIKSLGHRTWIGLTHSVHSLRSYEDLAGIWNMVARTAFCQLRYSATLLGGTTAIMIMVFWLPVAGLFFPAAGAKILSACALGTIILSYLPTLKFYHRSRVWALALPLIATLYLAMTWSSAIRFWIGAGSRWKGRFYKGHKKV